MNHHCNACVFFFSLSCLWGRWVSNGSMWVEKTPSEKCCDNVMTWYVFVYEMKSMRVFLCAMLCYVCCCRFNCVMISDCGCPACMLLHTQIPTYILIRHRFFLLFSGCTGNTSQTKSRVNVRLQRWYRLACLQCTLALFYIFVWLAAQQWIKKSAHTDLTFHIEISNFPFLHHPRFSVRKKMQRWTLCDFHNLI